MRSKAEFPQRKPSGAKQSEAATRCGLQQHEATPSPLDDVFLCGDWRDAAKLSTHPVSIKDAVIACVQAHAHAFTHAVTLAWNDALLRSSVFVDWIVRAVDCKFQSSPITSLVRCAIQRKIMQTEDGCAHSLLENNLLSLVRYIVFDAIVQELMRRGHQFVYCDQGIVVFLKSQRAADRVSRSIVAFCNCVMHLDMDEYISAGLLGNVTVGRYRLELEDSDGNSFANPLDADCAKIVPSQQTMRELKAEVRNIMKRSSGESYRHRLRRLNACVKRWNRRLSLCTDFSEIAEQLNRWTAAKWRAICLHENSRVRSRQSLLRDWGATVKSSRALARSRAGLWSLTRRCSLCVSQGADRRFGIAQFGVMQSA